MEKILGLDLGTNSIGWAIINAEFNADGKINNYKGIDDCGVRIFPEGVEPDTIGQGEKEKSKNATRREKRQTRRHFYRKRLRKIKLLEILIEQKMCPLSIEELKKWKNWDKKLKSEAKVFPHNIEFNNWIKQNPYELRYRALQEKLTLYEIGRVFYHLIQRRGFLSNRKGKEESTIFTKGKPEENIMPINITKEAIKNSTLGIYLYSILHRLGEPFKIIKDSNDVEIRARGRYTLRDMYIDEFEKIWQKQSEYYGLDKINVKSKRIRELKGSIEGKRNKRKIENLIKKYGKENIKVIKKGKGQAFQVVTTEYISLKKVLGGDIQIKSNNNEDASIQFKSNNSVLFWQRPLRSQKGLLANCRFEDNLPVINSKGEFVISKGGNIQTYSKKPCPLSHPEFELFRAYQFVNNIYYGKNQKLTTEQKSIVIELINNKDKSFDFIEIPKKLKLTYEKFNYDDDFKVPGNPTIKQLYPLFNINTWEEHYEEIWHCFYFYEDDDKLYEKLKKDFNYSDNIEKIKKVRLKEGYCNVSLKAIRNILPFLKKGYQYDKAVILGGVKNAFGKRWENFKDFHQEIEDDVMAMLKDNNKQGEAVEKIKDILSLPSKQYGFIKNDPFFTRLYHNTQEVEQKDLLMDMVPKVENLRNPIVQQGLNETRRLVNELIRKYKKSEGNNFYFRRIHIEMGRDLRNNKMKRQEIGFKIRDNEAKNNEARNRLAEFGLQPSRNNIQKFLMYKEIEDKAGKAQCPYTGKTISINQLFGTDNIIQIEHIIPYSISLDDSFANKTLCEAHFNNMKGEKTPYEFFNENFDPNIWGATSWEEIESRAFHILPYPKAKRFSSKKKFEISSFIERQLNDSRYIARKSVEMLSNICHDVRVMPGALTAELRHLWGLNNILQPIKNVDKLKFTINDENTRPYYVVIDENNDIINLYPQLNNKPITSPNEILIAGNILRNKFTEKYCRIDIDNIDLPDGKYWAKFKITENINLTPKFISKPQTDENSIAFRGKIEKGIFKNDTAGNYKINLADGVYWAKFKVINKKFEKPKKDNQPKTTRNQVSLFGNVSNGIFHCYIYQCYTNIPDGKYWIVLDLAPDEIEFIRAVNQIPEVSANQIVITATIDEVGKLVADVDKEFIKNTNQQSGKFYAVIELESDDSEFFRIENQIPEIEKGQKVVEGNIWVDKYTGEIKFDPKKNRDDHRHHVIDAITIALTEQGFLQRLSTYNAQRKDKERGKLDSTENFPEPWLNFYIDAKNAANSIIVSHKKNVKTLTKNKKGFSVRGQLHKENIFGKRHAPGQNERYHRRTKITELEDNKDIAKVVDTTIQKIIINHLRDNCNVDVNNPKGFKVPKDAFYRDGKWQIFLPNKNGEQVPVKKVRKKEVISNAMQLKTDINQYVNPRNNHHVLIYKDNNGNLKEDVVTFWTVIERKNQNQPVYQLPSDGKEIVTTLQENDMFLLGMGEDEINAINWGSLNKFLLSQYLYRVQKIAGGSYFMEFCFRHHLDSRPDKLAKADYIYIKNFGTGITGWYTYNPIKVEVDYLGDLKLK
ncbi:MAG: type II CRISPR RNA-guided endonuclease Cas9 [Bacteroidales bacterium]|nr:type II CRISPR RNA-guided endonuclease Cas9 [Bacteroidales bacterium]